MLHLDPPKVMKMKVSGLPTRLVKLKRQEMRWSQNPTRLTYNCAHLRSTKETLTIEYFRIILEKNRVKIFWVKIFWGENFWGENFLGENLFLGEKFLS